MESIGVMHLQKNLVQVCDQDLLADDHFLEKDGIKFAGLHLLVEFWGAKRLKDVRLIKAALGRAAKMADATVLGVHAHTFPQAASRASRYWLSRI